MKCCQQRAGRFQASSHQCCACCLAESTPGSTPQLLALGCGITNIVSRPTTTAAELSVEELATGARRLSSKVRRPGPRIVAVLGVSAYRAAFGRPRAGFGRQLEPIGETTVWVLPNRSGLNAKYRPADLARLYGELRESVGEEPL